VLFDRFSRFQWDKERKKPFYFFVCGKDIDEKVLPFSIGQRGEETIEGFRLFNRVEERLAY